MQDIIGAAITAENKRLQSIIKNDVPKYINNQLKNLLEVDEEFYHLTALKHDLRNFKYRQMQQEITKQNKYHELYRFSVKFLPTLKTSRHNIDYYAHLATYYSIYKLRPMPQAQSFLYLLCYINHRYEKVSDNVAQAFLSNVTQYIEDANENANTVILKEKRAIALDDATMGTLIGYYTDESMFEWKFKEVAQKAYKVLARDNIDKIKKYYKNKEAYRQELIWQYYVTKHKAIAMNLRPILCGLTLKCQHQNNPIFKAANFLQNSFKHNKKLKDIPEEEIPTKIIAKRYAPYVMDNNHINLKKYEFLVYLRLHTLLSSNKIYLNDSIQFKSFNEDIKLVSNWEEDGDQILKDLDNDKLNTDIEKQIGELEKITESLYMRVNNRIQSGENKYVKITEVNGKQKLTLTYPSNTEEFDHTFYRNIKISNISDVFDFVDAKCHFMDELSNLKPYQAKSRFDDQ